VVVSYFNNTGLVDRISTPEEKTSSPRYSAFESKKDAMLKNFINSITRSWIEYKGRKTSAPIVFPESEFVSKKTEIVSARRDFTVGTFGSFLSLPPMTAAILTSSTGERQVFLEGGYIKLLPGKYILEYVDLLERCFSLKISDAITADGFVVSLSISITYQITNPLRVLNIHHPLETLFSVCEASVRSFIRSHQHDDIIGEWDNEHPISDSEITRFIIQQVTQNHACKAFTIMGVTIAECRGDPKILEIRKTRLLQERQSQAERESLIRQQEVVEERKVLERKKAEQGGMISELQAQFESNRQQILYNASLLATELENLRKLPQMQQEQYLKALDVKQKALEALIQMQSMPGFPRNTNDMEVVNSIIKSMADTQILLPSPDSTAQTTPVKELSSTLINLIVPNKKNPSG
jgi:hypothetical protein